MSSPVQNLNPQQLAQHVQQLTTLVEELRTRVATLESVFSVAARGHKAILHLGDSSIILEPHEIEIKSSKVSIKASGDVVLKGAKIREN
ncbi:MAG: hypothetical protein AB7G75_23720 [Candidatus Binatia bacterium]